MLEPQSTENLPAQFIGTDVIIGVTGHRKFTNEQLLGGRTRSILELFDQILAHTPHTFTVVSSLSEGADRIVAREVMAWSTSEGMNKPGLEVVLPLPEEEYLLDFDTEQSREEFSSLLAQAKSKHVIENVLSREEAYDLAGRYVAHNCDVVIAIWDGKTAVGQGGTADIVGYARQIGRSIFWINSESGRITEERHADRSIESLEDLDGYNGEHLSSEKICSAIRDRSQILMKEAIRSGLSDMFLEPVQDSLLPQFVRADFLAQRYHGRHTMAGSAIYALAAAAVATVTIQFVWFEHLHELLWLEVAEIALILLLLVVSRLCNWHGKWIDYRSLAERLRVALFLCAAEIKCEPSVSPYRSGFSHRPNDWVTKAFVWVRDTQQKKQMHRDIPFEALKEFLLASWIEDQISFYRHKTKRHRKRHAWLAHTGELLFLFTLMVAIIHAVGLDNLGLSIEPAGHNTVVSVVIILPAIGASLAGIRAHYEDLRNAKRYDQIARHLSTIINEIRQSTNIEALSSLLEESNQLMLREHQEWREGFILRELETP